MIPDAKTKPKFLRYADIEAELNIPRWMARRICLQYGVKAKRVRNGGAKENPKACSVLIERESFLAALEFLPDAYKPSCPPVPAQQVPQVSAEMPPTDPANASVA